MKEKKSKDLEERVLVKQNWLESERGWGIRPDGCSLHKTVEDCKQYIKKYWAGMPDQVPDEYSRPEGEPYPIDVDERIYSVVSKSKNGIRVYSKYHFNQIFGEEKNVGETS